MSQKFKSRIKVKDITGEQASEVISKKYGEQGIQTENNRLLSPYDYLKFYNKMVDNIEPTQNSPLTQKSPVIQQSLTNFKFYPLNKIEIPSYLENDHQKEEEIKKKTIEKNLTGSETQLLQDELLLHKRTEELLNQIAENNKKQEKVIYRTHNVVPTIIKNGAQIDFIDSSQKKYFSISRQLMDEISKHKLLPHFNSPQTKGIKPQQETTTKLRASMRLETQNSIQINPNKSVNSKDGLTPRSVQSNTKIQNALNHYDNHHSLSRQTSSQIDSPRNLVSNQTSPNQHYDNYEIQINANTNSKVRVRQQMGGNITQAVQEKLKSQKMQHIKSEQEHLKERYLKKIDHISKNMNPDFYMSKCVLDRKNITLRKILLSIPQNKLVRIYEKKKQDFNKSIFKTHKFVQQQNQQLKRFIKPTFNNILSRLDGNQRKEHLKMASAERQHSMTSRIDNRRKDDSFMKQDNILERHSLTYRSQTNQTTRNNSNSFLNQFNHTSTLNSSTQINSRNGQRVIQQKLNILQQKSNLLQQKSNVLQQQSHKFTKINEQLGITSYQSINKQEKKINKVNLSQQSLREKQRQSCHFIDQQSSLDTQRRSTTRQMIANSIKIIDQTKQKDGNRSESHNVKSQCSITEDEDKPNKEQKILRVKNPVEVLLRMFRKSARKQSLQSNSTQETSNSTAFHSQTNNFNKKQYGQKCQFLIKDNLAQAFESYRGNLNSKSESLRKLTQISQQYSTQSIHRHATMNQSSPFNFASAFNSTSHKDSIFDFNKYFMSKYNPSLGIQLTLSKHVQESTDQFQTSIQNFINSIDQQVSQEKNDRCE